MKTRLTIIIISIFLGLGLQAQEVPGLLDEAGSEYKAGNLEDARFALQQALNGINQAIGRDILELMPEELGGMPKVAEEDDVTGVNVGFAGLFVSRNYRNETSDASMEIVSDSPLLGSIGMLLSMPTFLNSDPNQKRIKVDGQKALLTKSASEEGPVSYDVQLVFGSSLFTFRTNGVENEDDVISMLDKIPLREIIEVAQ
ncbi:MAG: hypothetical protein ACLFPE_09480 [Bacteroidales bacterium]